MRRLPVIILIFLASCSAVPGLSPFGGGTPPAKTEVSGDLERSSEALFRFLVGQIEYDQENYEAAEQNFVKASELATDPTPLIHARLAELHLKSGKLEEALSESSKAIAESEPRVSSLLLHAGILDALDRPEEAISFYLKVLNKDPDTADTYVLLSTIYSRLEDHEEAINVMKRYVARLPKEAIGLYYLARAYELGSKFSEAASYYKTTFELKPDNSDIAIDIVRTEIRAGNISKARLVLEDLIRQEPTHLKARKILGQIMLEEGEYSEALIQLEALKKIESDPTDTRFKIALIEMERQNIPGAIRELQLITAQNPDYGQARYYLASLYAGLGKRVEAIDELVLINNKSELFDKAKTFQAFLLRQNGDLAGAERAIREALGGSYKNLHLLNVLVALLRDQGKLLEARKALENGREHDTSDQQFNFSYALILDELGERALAKKILSEIVEANADHSDALNFLAYIMVEDGDDLNVAKKYVERALSVKPTDGYYLDTLGWIQFKNGELAAALDTLTKSVALVGEDSVILEHYADVLAAAGKPDKAVESYRRALALATGIRADEERTALAERIRQKLELLEVNEPSNTQ